MRAIFPGRLGGEMDPETSRTWRGAGGPSRWRSVLKPNLEILEVVLEGLMSKWLTPRAPRGDE